MPHGSKGNKMALRTSRVLSAPLRLSPVVPKRLRTLPSTFRSRALTALVLAFAALLPGCDDPSCVFSPAGCNGGGGGGLAGDPALLPEGGQVILDGRPTLEAVFPDGTADVHPRMPMTLVFSESVQLATVADSLEVVVESAGGGPSLPVLVASASSPSGRLVFLLAVTDLPAGEIVIRATDAPLLTDITGQRLALSAGQELARFTVTDDASTIPTPGLVTTFPPTGATAVDDTTEIVAVFDRDIQQNSVTLASFAVRVGGTAPTRNPVATPLVREGIGTGTPDFRVYVYRSVDEEGRPVPLGTGQSVTVDLSPAGAKLLDNIDLMQVPAQTVSFTTANISAPTDARIGTNPTDAIGVNNLTSMHADELRIELDLAAGEPGDILDAFLIGTNLDETEPQLIALRRSLTLSDAAPITTATFDLPSLDLLASASPLRARFADGVVAFAFRHRRGAVFSALHVLDVDADAPGLQDAILDTVAPTFSGFLDPDGGLTRFHTDLREFAVVGQADEFIRRVDVTHPGGTNALNPSAVGSSDDGLFIASPIDPITPLTSGVFSATVYDAALNAAPTAMGTFELLGLVGTTAFTPGDDLTVQVYDRTSKALLQGARVIVHSDDGDGINYPFVDSASTTAAGIGTVATANAPSVGAILTVDLPGYDRFTFHGVTATRVSVPLSLTGTGPTAVIAGSIRTSLDSVGNVLQNATNVVADTRRPAARVPIFESAFCFPNPAGGIECAFGPETIFPDRIGAQSYFGGEFLLPDISYGASDLLQAFDLRVPAAPTATMESDAGVFQIPFLIDDPTNLAERPRNLPNTVLEAQPLMSLAGTLVGDPKTTGDPIVTVDAQVPGLPDPVVVGLGLAFARDVDTWDVGSTIPGAVGASGFFLQNGTVRNLRLRTEIRDIDGDRVGARALIGDLSVPPAAATVLVPIDASTMTSPAPGGNSGSETFNVVFTDVIPDFFGGDGMIRVDLFDSTGRGWSLWTMDGPGLGGPLTVHVPDLSGEPLPGLADGTIGAVVSVWGLTLFDPASFFWTDLERTASVFSQSRPFVFSQP